MKTWEDEVSTLLTLALVEMSPLIQCPAALTHQEQFSWDFFFRRLDGPAKWPGSKGKEKNSCLCQRYINSLVTQ
jgi:hypothetical protein